MRPRDLMSMGLMTFIASGAALLAEEAGVAWILALGAGMLFGKGYGVFEERTRDD